MLAEWRVPVHQLSAFLVILLHSLNELCRLVVYTRATVIEVGVVELLLSKLIEKETVLCKARHDGDA